MLFYIDCAYVLIIEMSFNVFIRESYIEFFVVKKFDIKYCVGVYKYYNELLIIFMLD